MGAEPQTLLIATLLGPDLTLDDVELHDWAQGEFAKHVSGLDFAWVSSVTYDFGDKTIVSETRGLKTEPCHPTIKSMWFFYGSEGIIADTSLFDPKGNLVRAFAAGHGDAAAEGEA